MGGKQSFPIVQIPKGRTFVVTGASRGIGYETTKWIAMMGGTVVMACRSQDAAVQAMRRMNKEYKELKSRGETPGLVDVEELSLYFMPLDLSSLQSTKEFVHTYRESGRPLHVLVCNAGVVKAIPEKTDDGFESMLQVNYLSHFLLVGLLLPMMKNAAADDDIRVVMVSSDAHRMCKFDLETIDYSGEPEKFGYFDYYGRSKLYQIMQAHCLRRRLRNTGITVSAVHPGMVETDIGREFLDNKMWQLFVSFNRLIGMLQCPYDGARTVIDLAVNPALQGAPAVYYKNCSPGGSSAAARSEVHQEALWTWTMETLKDHFKEDEVYCLEGADPV